MISKEAMNQKEVVVFQNTRMEEYSVQELVDKIAKESDNVGHNILNYYVTIYQIKTSKNFG